mmetsp:Transcript_62664/g.101499  ORF Transcript_62664/g.101499 Transcript_62664/m.101499 type:complete len:103 (+) Transcript_62664:80-388(+)
MEDDLARARLDSATSGGPVRTTSFHSSQAPGEATLRDEWAALLASGPGNFLPPAAGFPQGKDQLVSSRNTKCRQPEEWEETLGLVDDPAGTAPDSRVGQNSV